jgi:hypothetical protein
MAEWPRALTLLHEPFDQHLVGNVGRSRARHFRPKHGGHLVRVLLFVARLPAQWKFVEFRHDKNPSMGCGLFPEITGQFA